MKKHLFLFAAAALALASCNSDDTIAENSSSFGNQQQKEISLFAVNQKATRAAVQGGTFPTANTMEVRAYQTAPTTGDYFEKTTFSKGETYWGGNPKRYWPLGAASLNFFAVSGAGVTASDITIADALASAAVSYKTKDNTSESTYSATTQSDIMYAFGRQSVGVSGNTLTFNPVAMEFKHALALIKFQVKAGNDASEAINITSIVVNGAKYTGSLSLTNDENVIAGTGNVTTTVAWTPDAAVDNVTVNNSAIGALDDAAFKPADGGAEGTWACAMIVPGTGNGISNFVINYTLGGKAYSYTYNPSLANTVAGTVYTYQITMTLHEIQVNPSVSAWTGTSTPVAVPGT